MQSTVIAVDLAKSVFQIAVSHRAGVVSQEHRLRRSGLLRYFAQQPPATVVMEACSTAHHWARQFESLGHGAVLLPAHRVRAYVPRDKTDRADARGLLEAYRNRDIRAVPVKTRNQQVLAAHHRLRQGWIARRTACLNAMRGLLREQGLFVAAGARRVVPWVRDLLGQDGELPEALKPLLAEQCAEVEQLERRIARVERQLVRLTRDDPRVTRARSVPGVGPLTATALVAFVGDLERFGSSRHFASYLGLTPRVHGSGLRTHRGRISKRGDAYLRYLLIHGARSVLYHAASSSNPDRLRRWALQINQRLRPGQVTVALANKLARILWAVVRRERSYSSETA